MAKRIRREPRGFMDVYTKRYDTSQGFGCAAEWKRNFTDRMGWDEAMTILNEESPEAVLGLSAHPTVAEITAAFRKLALQWHPDKWMQATPDEYAAAEAKFKRFLAAKTVLMERYR